MAMSVRNTKNPLLVFGVFLLAACSSTGPGLPPAPDSPSAVPPISTAQMPVEIPVVDPSPSIPQNQPQLPASKGGSSSPAIDTPFWLSVGQTAALDVQDSSYAITFVGVTEDSRCPQGAQCIVAGTVSVIVRVAKDAENPVEIRLSRGDVGETQSTVQVEAIALTLSKVSPLAAVGESVDPAAYQLELLIEN